MVELFEKDSDYKTICSWFEKREIAPIPEDVVPNFGLIVPDVAAGFLLVTDCNLGILDFYISNPEANPKDRDLALDEITGGLIKYGRSVGITNFKADTQIEAIKTRAKYHGFDYLGETALLFLKVRE